MDRRFASILKYAMERYEEESLRFDHIESKCERFMVLLTLSIGLLTGLTGAYIPKLVPPESLLDWIITIAIFINFLSLASAWGHALLALKVREFPVAPYDNETFDYLKNVNYEEFQTHLINCYTDSLNSMDDVISDKVRNLEIIYKDVALFGWSFGSLLILILIKEWI